MRGLWALLLLGIPVVEVWLLLSLPLPLWFLVGWCLLTAAVGWWFARTEGLSLWTELESDVQNGIVPTAEGVEAMLVVLAGWGLILPGWLTDIAGALLLVPALRRSLLEPIRGAVRRHFIMGRR